ncbi:MAG: pitrilysin family protein [Bacteroidia bacterium]|nr:insulinase family protein [Bacteroidia bacterium]MDW8134849.1 pitrilysin family protein [Bacteroidia bacterium]
MIQIHERIWFLPRPFATSAYILFLWNRGSRHDPTGQEGLLHFVEHTLFKGTKRYKRRQIFQQVEGSGGELNAFTTKDKIGIEMRIPPSALSKALHTLYELAYEAIFPEKEVEREREVILEEIAMYEDIPEESLLDHFEEQIFSEGGLRHPIIGYSHSLREISSRDLQKYYRENLAQTPAVLLIAGPFSEKVLVSAIKANSLLNSLASTCQPSSVQEERLAPPSEEVIERNTSQLHLVIGGVGPANYDWSKSLPLQLILYEIAGPQMSSYLNSLLREKYGWCYSVYSFFHGYIDYSTWGIYAGLTPEVRKEAKSVIAKALVRWIDAYVSASKLSKLKRAFVGRQGIAWESISYRLFVEGKYLLDKGKTFDFREWLDKIGEISSYQLQKVAEEFFQSLYMRVFIPKR